MLSGRYSALTFVKAIPSTRLQPLPGTSSPHRLRHRRERRRISMAGSAEKDLKAVPGNHTDTDPATQDFILQQTMYRIKDPKRSLDFYTGVLGMRLLTKLDFPEMKFSLYFLGYHPASAIPDDPADRVEWMFSQPASLELTHNWGTESDANFKGYHSGNDEPKGYGHIGLAVPDVEAACKRFEELGVAFVKKPNDEKMKNIAFIKDPDGYWIEILNPKASRQFA